MSIWDVTFLPYIGSNRENIFNFGNLPLIYSSSEFDALKIDIITVRDGWSPFSVHVESSQPSQLGTTGGVCGSKTTFAIQIRDKFFN